LRVKFKPESTFIKKGTALIDYREIKTGDMVNIVYKQIGKKNRATFIRILTEEELRSTTEEINLN